MHRARTADKAAKLRLDEMTRVKKLLALAGFTLLDVDREYRLPRGSAGSALRHPHLRGERAIAAILKERPDVLWASRYNVDGTRKTPQPKANYNRLPTMAERREAFIDGQDAA